MEDYREEFEELGPDTVAKYLSTSIWSEDKSRAARKWLDKESSRIARSAKNAAWIAAIAAVISAAAAIVAIVVSLLRR
jgi:type IV secretory pathway component VirB8